MSTENDTFGLRLTELLRDDMLRILSLAENSAEDSESIAMLAKHSLRTADAFLLSNQQIQLPLEPLTAISVLHQVAHDTYPLAKSKGIELRVDVRGSSRPILVHRQSLRDMLGLITTAVLQQQTNDNSSIVLGTHRSARGTVVGAFGSDELFIKPKLMPAGSQQTSSAEVLLSVASRLGERLQTQVKNYKHTSLNGFGATFHQSHQLQLFT